MSKIAFFDSGVGGLTALHEAVKRLPHEHFVYYGDSLNAPYGTRSRPEICELVFSATDLLVQHHLKALVLACNTATSVAVEDLRRKYGFPILGMEPAVKLAVKSSGDKRILVTATDRTLKEEKLKNLVVGLNVYDRVDFLSLQNLVMFAEHFEFDTPEVEQYLTQKIHSVDWNRYDALVLGCTHFIYFRRQIERLLPPGVKVLDGNEGTVNHLLTKISLNPETEKGSVEYYISGYPDTEGRYLKYMEYLDRAK
ncbi:MAG: glutamate racemase [Bacteroidia bacterium]|nr:glutamate racemase [Bacteroidia bacterium]